MVEHIVSFIQLLLASLSLSSSSLDIDGKELSEDLDRGEASSKGEEIYAVFSSSIAEKKMAHVEG